MKEDIMMNEVLVDTSTVLKLVKEIEMSDYKSLKLKAMQK
jgi:hypothetical protein